MAIANRWAVRNVAKCTFYSIPSAGEKEKILAYLENLKSSDINVTSETVYARGGDGNPKLIGFSSNKEVRIELSSAIFDNRVLALLTGNSMSAGAEDVYRREVLSVADDEGSKIITLSAIPQGDLLGVYEMTADGIEGEEYIETTNAPDSNEYSIASNVLTFADTITEGKKFIIYYVAKTADTTQTIIVSSDKFPAAFKLVMEVLVTDFHTKKLYPAQIVIPSAKMEDSWTLSFRPDGDPEPLNFPIEVLKPVDSSDMLTMKIYDDENLVKV